MSTTADIRELTGDDSLVGPEDGSVWFAPYRAYHVEDGPDDYLVSSEILKVRLVDGVATVDLPVTPVDNLMKVQLRGVRGYGAPWYVQIPAGDHSLFDLPHIDPDSMDPIAPPSPAWLAALEAVTDDVAANTTGLSDLTTVVAGLELGAASDAAVSEQVENGALTGAAVDARVADGITGKADTTSVYDKTASDARYATAAQGTKADNAATAANLTAETTRATTAEGLLAPKASPTFTGNPTAPTPSPGDNDTSVATTAFVAAADALKADKPTLAGKTLSIYGDSWTDESAMVPTVVPTSGEMYFRRLATALGGNSPVTYGKVGTRIGYGVGSMLSTGTWAGLPAPITGALWPGVSSRPGPVILDFLTNDIAHTNGVTLPPVAISGAGGTRYTNAVAASFEAACALVSTETRREIATGVTDVTLTGAGAVSYGATYLSGGDFTWLTSSGDRVDLANVTPPQSGPLAGRVYIGTINFDPSVIGNANALVSVDGGTAWTWTNPEWESYGASGAMNQSYAVIPVDLPVDGTNHSIRVEWSGSGYLGLDVLLIPSTTPPAIYILDKPDPIVGSVWNATDIGVWKSNAVILKPAIQAAVARFSNAVWVPSTMTPGVLAYDGVHPNSAGQEQRYKDIAAAVKLRQLVS